MKKHKFRYGEENYTICITRDDWWIEEPVDMPERMISAANEFALENGMDEVTKHLPNSLCPTCKDGVLATVVGNYTLKSVARLGGKSLVLKDIIRDECPKCGGMIFPWQSCKKIDDSVAALASQNETLPP